MTPTAFALMIALVLLGNARAVAQAPASSATFAARDGTVDLAVPESPAFAALGLAPNDVVRPTTARDLATSILNGVDREGHLQTGLSVDVAPYMLLAGSRLTLSKYREPAQRVTRFLARWQMSLASAKGASDADPAARIALGARVTFFDHGDPRLDTTLLDCLRRQGAKMLASAPKFEPGQSPEELAEEKVKLEDSVRQAAKPCRTAAAARRWNRSAWIAGMAPTWTSVDGSASALGYTGTALWTSIAYGFESVPAMEERAMLAVYAKRRSGERAPNALAKGTFIEQDHASVGARLIVGSASSHFSGEALWVRNDRVDGLNDRFWNVSAGLEQRVVDNIWLSVTVGRQAGRDAGSDAFSVVSAFNWGLGAKE